MSYLEGDARSSKPAAANFGFELKRSPTGWRWTAFNLLGEVAAEGLAPTKATAAARVIDALART